MLGYTHAHHEYRERLRLFLEKEVTWKLKKFHLNKRTIERVPAKTGKTLARGRY